MWEEEERGGDSKSSRGKASGGQGQVKSGKRGKEGIRERQRQQKSEMLEWEKEKRQRAHSVIAVVKSRQAGAWSLGPRISLPHVWQTPLPEPEPSAASFPHAVARSWIRKQQGF